MKAITIWQPWASLIMIGAKPYEFRGWNYADRPGGRALVGARVVIHAGARPVHHEEVGELLYKLDRHAGDGKLDHGTGLKVDLARELLVRVFAAHSSTPILPLRCGLGTAVLGRARPPLSTQHNWAWPLSEIEPFDAPVPARGMQGFFDWQLAQEAA